MQKVKEIKSKIGFIGESRENILGDLNFAIKNKFDYYEISPESEDFSLTPKIIKQIKKISKNNNLFLNLHIPYFLPINSFIPEISEVALKIVKKEIILANKLGVREVTIHSSDKEIPRLKTTVVKNFEVLIKNLREAVKFGGKYGIKIGLENSWTSERLCRKAEDLLRVVNSVKRLGIVFDAGHANTTGSDLLGYFRKVKNQMINMHISDNDGKFDQHALIGKGNINFKGLLKECKNSNYYGPFILEIFPRKDVLKGKERFLNLWS